MIARQIRLDMRYTVEAMLRRIARSAWCRSCDEIVDWLTVCEAAQLAGINPPILFMWVKMGRVHYLNTRGENLICANSIQRGEAVTGQLDRRPIK